MFSLNSVTLSLIFSVIPLIQVTLIELSVESVILSIFEFSAASTTRHRIVDKCHRSVNSLMIRLTRTHSDSDQAGSLRLSESLSLSLSPGE